MERLNQHAANELAAAAAVMVIGPKGCAAHLSGMAKVIEVPHRPIVLFFLAMVWHSVVQALRFRPHIVLAGSGLTAPFALMCARLAGARMVTYLHGLDVAFDHFLYRMIWLPSIRRSEVCLVNSRYTAGLARKAGVDPSRLQVLNPGVEVPTPDPQAKSAFRSRFNLGDGPVLVFAGRLTARKGLLEFVERSLPAIVESKPETLLLVIGDEPVNSLIDQGAGAQARIVRAAETLAIERNLVWLGWRDYHTLSAAYAAADVQVFPVLSLPGDVEGFGMVAIEAAANGCRTVGFNVGGLGDAIAEGISGALIDPGDYQAFSRSVLDVLDSGAQPEIRSNCIEFARRFAWPVFGDRLRQAILGHCGQDAKGAQ